MEGAIWKICVSTCNYIILEQKCELWWGSSCWDGVAIRQVLPQVLINGRGSLLGADA